MENRIAYCLILVFMVASCSDNPRERRIAKLNPTTYVYDIGLRQMYEAIISVFGGNSDFQLYYKEGLGNPLDSITIFEQQGNANDFVLRPSDYAVYMRGYRKSYRYPDHEYLAEYHVHLDSVDTVHTRLIIYTLDPKIIVGKEFWPSGMHLTRLNKYKIVEPSTIEEYEILFAVGVKIGQKMPAVQYPE